MNETACKNICFTFCAIAAGVFVSTSLSNSLSPSLNSKSFRTWFANLHGKERFQQMMGQVKTKVDSMRQRVIDLGW